MIDLKDKKILFISPSFFGYEKSVLSRLEELGATVDYFDERPANSFWTKAFIRVNRKVVVVRINNYYKRIACVIRDKKYDYVFVINIEAMPHFFLEKLRRQSPEAKFILYMWDSIRNKAHTRSYLHLFDSVFSFDENDCKKIPHIQFRPLFFLNEYKAIASDTRFEYDLSFVGTAHSDRFALIRKIQRLLQRRHLKTCWYLYLQSRKLFILNKAFNPSFRNARLEDFNYKALPKNTLIDIIRKSRIVLDIQHPNQAGLTMRTIEMLGAARKLITTNAAITHYDFYSPQNILVVDRENPVIPDCFWESDYQPVDDIVYYKYSVDGWLADIFRTK